MDKGFAVLEIDPEFKTLIRPLRKDEYLQLEVNLAVDGCREPIITWNMNAASTSAKSKLEEALLSLQKKVSEMLSEIREVD